MRKAWFILSLSFATSLLADESAEALRKEFETYLEATVDNNDFDTTTSLREAYAGGRGVWDAKKEALFWAGNRFYEHRDMAGFGGGIEDVAIGDEMKWALAWLGGSIDDLDSSGTAFANDYHFNKNTIDARLYDIDAGVGNLALSFDIADFSGDTLDINTPTDVVIEDSLGCAVGAILKSDLTDTLANKFTAQS